MKDIVVGGTITDGNKIYQIESRIGKGGFGIIYKALCDSQKFAVKVLDSDNQRDKLSFRNEFDAAIKINSKHAIKYYYLNEDGKNDYPMFIIME